MIPTMIPLDIHQEFSCRTPGRGVSAGRAQGPCSAVLRTLQGGACDATRRVAHGEGGAVEEDFTKEEW